MRRLVIRTLLLVSGAVLTAIGIAVLFQPHAFFAANAATLEGDPTLISEVRSPGGLLLTSGILVLLGAVRTSLFRLALMLSALVFGSYGISRVVSMILDGMPSMSLVAATGVELVVGFCALMVLFGPHHRPIARDRVSLTSQTVGDHS